MDVWDRIKQQLRNKLTREAWSNWVERTVLARQDGGVLQVVVPDEATRDYLENDIGTTVLSAMHELTIEVRGVSYVVAAAARAGGYGVDAPAIGLHPEPENGTADGLSQAGVQLNRRFTFDSFVVGPCNQFAHAAAQAVATRPSRSYNPLFIYGGVGMGKTHLMHAIGRSLIDGFNGMRVVYTTSERFVNLMIQCIRTDRMSQ
jgi:chromosomal replication initiator protein